MRKHKFLAVLLALVMALSLLPTAAFAEEAGETPADDPAGIPTALTEETVEDIAPQAEEYVAKIGDVGYATLGAAVNAVPVNGTAAITLLSDTTENVSVSYNEDITLDLGGHTLTGYVYVSRGTLTLENGTVSNPGSYAAAMTGSTSDTADYSILNVESTATVKGLWGACLFDKSNLGYGMVLNVAGTIDGDIFVQGLLGNTAESAEALAAGNAPVVNIKDGAVIKDDEGPGIAMNGYAIVNVENGASVTGTEAIAVKRGVLNITGGTFTATGEKQDSATANHNGTEATGAAISVTSTYNYAGKIEVNINGGSFTSQNNSALYVGHSVESNDSSNTYEKGLSIDIKDGQFTGADGADAVYIAEAADGDDESYTQEVIRGGIFSSNISTYVVAGSAAILDEDNQNWTIGVDPDKTVVAVIGNTGYENLQVAVDAARSGETVTLRSNTTEDITVAAGQEITLDLGGKTLTNVSGHTITNNGTLTITDSVGGGTVDNVTHARGALVNSAGATVVLEGGTFTRSAETSTSASDNGGNSWYVLDNAGTMTIDGATVINMGYFSSLIRNKGTSEAAAELTIASGTVQQDNFIAVKNDDYSELHVTGGHIISNEQTIQNWTTAEITGGTLDGAVITWSYTGGPSETTISDNAVINGDVMAVNYDNGNDIATVNITGGAVNGELKKGLYNKGVQVQDPGATSSDINISGGSFSTKVAEEYCADSFAPATLSNGRYTVTQEGTYLITIVGPNGKKEDMSAVTLDSEGKVTGVQQAQEINGSLMIPANTTLPYWRYVGWTFIAAKDGTTETFGTTKTLTQGLADWMTLKIKDGWSLKMDSATPGIYTPSSSSSRDDDDDGYSVSVPSGSSIKNGAITVSPRTADKGDTVTITVKPDDGYELDELTVKDSSGKTVKLTEKRDNQYTFTMPASGVRVQVSFIRSGTAPERRFTDVPDGYWAEDEINWAADSGYMNGNTAATFNPEGTVTRQQLWMILARLSGYQPADFDEARAWAMDNSISDGTNPGGAVSRQQLVTILYRYAERMGHNTAGSADLTAYPDHASVAAYATGAMGWSVANGIVGGTAQGTLAPAGTATRAQFAAILYRFCDKIAG